MEDDADNDVEEVLEVWDEDKDVVVPAVVPCAAAPTAPAVAAAVAAVVVAPVDTDDEVATIAGCGSLEAPDEAVLPDVDEPPP